jgi:phosphoribosylaminoimidazole-succinocarboxamide synthase
MDMDVSARLIRVRETGAHNRHTSIMPDPIQGAIPVECVVRNICAGSMAQRYGIPEGTKLREPVFEFFLGRDSLHDPLRHNDHARVLGWATIGEIAQMKTLTHRVNEVDSRWLSALGPEDR